MEKDIYEAVKYASSSNELENNELSDTELNKIIDDITSGRTDESFLYSVIQLLETKSQEKEVDQNNAKTRK